MIDAAASAELVRAERARAELLRNIRDIKKMGDNMMEKTEIALHKAPLLLGIGAAGLALVGVVVVASRRPAPRFSGPARERSFLAEAARSAALSALGILAGRITQRLLTAAMEPPPTALP